MFQMAPERSAKRIWTVVAIDFALLLVLALAEWNLMRAGTFGLTFDLTQGTVISVQPSTPAALAGVKTGDRIDLHSIGSALERRILLVPRIGESVHFRILHDGALRTVAMTAVHADNPLPKRLDAVGFPILVLTSVGLSTLLVLLRPQAATWAFYIYTILITIKAFEGNLFVRPAAGMAIVQIIFELAWSAAIVALLFFSTRIFASSRHYRGYVEAAAIALGLADAYAWSYPTVAYLMQSGGNGPWTVLQRLLDFALLSVVLCTLLAIALSSRRERRQHVLWVLVGISLVPLVEWIDAAIYLGFLANPSLSGLAMTTDAVDVGLQPWLPIAASLSVYYALVHERVVDIRFAIGRAAEYALTTAVVIVVFAILEWAFGQLFEGSRIAAYATLLAAVIAGFSFNAVHSRVDQLIEAIFFWKERDAHERLMRVARALLYANSERLVLEFLLDHPLDALELTSGAIFVLNDSRTAFHRIADRHWDDASLAEIATDDALVAQLHAVQQPLLLRTLGWYPDGLPAGDKRPALAVQVLMRGEVFAIALYGRHVNGAVISKDEQELLNSVAASAAAAFDHLEAERTRREIEALRSENAALHKLTAQ
jgi:hypothetical protein